MFTGKEMKIGEIYFLIRRIILVVGISVINIYETKIFDNFNHKKCQIFTIITANS